MKTTDEQVPATGEVTRCRYCLPVALTICIGLACTLSVAGVVYQPETSAVRSVPGGATADTVAPAVEGTPAAPKLISSRGIWHPLAVVVVGLLLTGCVVAFQVIAIGHADQVRRLVETRTRELRRSTDELRQSEERFRGFAERIIEEIFMLDSEGNVEYASPSAERIWGLSPGEIVGMPYLDYIADADKPRLVEEFRAVIERGEERLLEFTGVRKGGETFEAEVSAYPILVDGKIAGVQGLLRDITSRKRAEEALRKKDEQLRQKQKMEAIGGLAGGVAHEFNNLLQAIQGYTRFALAELQPDEQAYKDLQQAMSAADRAAALTRQLLSFSRQRSLDRRPLDPNRVVREFLKMARPLVGEHIDVEVLLDASLDNVCADANMLEQVLMNLCVNARDAMPSGGRLTISTDDLVITSEGAETHPDLTPGRYVRIMVTDTGCGMPREVRDRVFEPFFTTKDVGKGTGLGMATVYSIVQKHRGAIHVYSEPGQGTTFRIYLPVDADSTDSRAEPGPAPLSQGNETILIAEDEPLVRDVAVRILQKAGYATVEAEDGQQAVALAEEHGKAVSLALLDVVMPKMSGHEAYRQIVNLQPQIKAIFCTGYDPAAEQTRSVLKDGLRLVEKPFIPETLLRAIREILDGDSPESRPAEPVADVV